MIYLLLFWEFFQIGLFCFGGAFGMIPLIEETVVRNGWMTEEAFYSLVGVCESTPGPIAVNMATYIGSTQGGLLGSIVATLGVVLPSFLIILLIAAVLKNLTRQVAIHFRIARINRRIKGTGSKFPMILKSAVCHQGSPKPQPSGTAPRHSMMGSMEQKTTHSSLPTVSRKNRSIASTINERYPFKNAYRFAI